MIIEMLTEERLDQLRAMFFREHMLQVEVQKIGIKRNAEIYIEYIENGEVKTKLI